MKLEKKHWIIIGVVVAIILVWYYFFLRKKKAESGYRGSAIPECLFDSDCGMGYTCKSGKCSRFPSESSWKPDVLTPKQQLAPYLGLTRDNLKYNTSVFGTPLESSYRTGGNPIEDCMKRCQTTMPREYCVSYCTGGQDTQPTILGKTGKTGHVTVLKGGEDGLVNQVDYGSSRMFRTKNIRA